MNNENFNKVTKNKDGFNHKCKLCQKKHQDEYYKNNREHLIEIAKQNMYANYDKHLIALRKNNARPETKEKFRKNQERLREEGYFKDYFEKYPEKLKLYGRRRYGKNHRITTKEWEDCKHYFANRCAYCGLPIEEHWVKRNGKLILMDLHKEHVIECGKDNLSNCIPACQSCNDRKWLFTINEWYNPNNPLYTYERYYKIYQWLRYDHKKYIRKRRPKGKYIKQDIEYWNKK